MREREREQRSTSPLLTRRLANESAPRSNFSFIIVLVIESISAAECFVWMAALVLAMLIAGQSTTNFGDDTGQKQTKVECRRAMGLQAVLSFLSNV